MDDVCAHLNGIRAFLTPKSASIPREAIRQHIDGATRALTEVDAQIKKLKRKLEARRQQVDNLRKFIPLKIVLIVKDVSTVI